MQNGAICLRAAGSAPCAAWQARELQRGRVRGGDGPKIPPPGPSQPPSLPLFRVGQGAEVSPSPSGWARRVADPLRIRSTPWWAGKAVGRPAKGSRGGKGRFGPGPGWGAARPPLTIIATSQLTRAALGAARSTQTSSCRAPAGIRATKRPNPAPKPPRTTGTGSPCPGICSLPRPGSPGRSRAPAAPSAAYTACCADGEGREGESSL